MSQPVKDQELSKPQPILLKDYLPPSHLIEKTELFVELHDLETFVRGKLHLVKNPKREGNPALVLNGEQLDLQGVWVDGAEYTDFTVTEDTLTFGELPERCIVETRVRIEPQNNKSLEGLYQSRGIYCTQCEAHGFRRITYYLDRPDVLSRFTTTITAEAAKYPVMLSNGNLVDEEILNTGRRRVVWEDPFPKPAYLFALVAGNLAVSEDTFTTMSGRDVTLQIFVEHGNEARTTHAMESLKASMKWDEEKYGREYDLDLFMIVAVDDFNFGAMENKGLNIFNSVYILANKDTATDAEFQGIEGVVAHEYFHNWTGNRITCRDWFQLTLKEGLTVFRDEEFSSDMNSRPVKRIDVARFMRDFQFVEDAGPNAHPIRPEKYIEINNFYTNTVYQKGAEVIRMIHTLIGPEAYRKGTDLYFERFDGQAVTTEDFVSVMEEASGLDLTQFRETWYSQAGTPVCDVSMDYQEGNQEVLVTIRQSCPPTPETAEKKPFYFPFCIGFVGHSGQDLETTCEGNSATTHVLHIKKAEQTFVFSGVTEKAVPSLLRNFSAPVRVNYPYTMQEEAFLLAHDSDPFNRYDAGQRLATQQLRKMMANKEEQVHPSILEAFGKLLEDAEKDPAFVAEAMVLPSVTALVEPMEVCDFEGAFQAREAFLEQLAVHLEPRFVHWYEAMGTHDSESLHAKDMGMRRLRNVCLAYLAQVPSNKYLQMLTRQYHDGKTMTEQFAALGLLCNTETTERDEALEQFAKRWAKDPLVMNKFFSVQACAKLPSTLEQVKKLEQHSGFDSKNPNKIRSLIGRFAANLPRFHDASGDGYAYVADKILEIDRFNTNVAGRLSTAFKKYAKLDAGRKAKMKDQLERILATKGLSPDVYEIVSKTLAQ